MVSGASLLNLFEYLTSYVSVGFTVFCGPHVTRVVNELCLHEDLKFSLRKTSEWKTLGLGSWV